MENCLAFVHKQLLFEDQSPLAARNLTLRISVVDDKGEPLFEGWEAMRVYPSASHDTRLCYTIRHCSMTQGCVQFTSEA